MERRILKRFIAMLIGGRGMGLSITPATDSVPGALRSEWPYSAACSRRASAATSPSSPPACRMALAHGWRMKD